MAAKKKKKTAVKRKAPTQGMKALEYLTQERLVAVYNYMLDKEVNELKAMLKKGNMKALDAIIVRIIVDLAETSNLRELEVLLNRMVGSAANFNHFSQTENDAPIAARNVSVIVTVPSNGREAPTK